MNSFKALSNYDAQFLIDNEVYSKSVIAKVLYWLSGNYVISSNQIGKITSVMIHSQEIINDWNSVEKRISQQFCDFAMREVVLEETKDIRNILYIKAFANIEDFVEYDIPED